MTCYIRLPLIFFILYNNPIYFSLPANNPNFKIFFNNPIFAFNELFKKLNEIAIIPQAYKVDHCINSNHLYIHIPSTRDVKKFQPAWPNLSTADPHPKCQVNFIKKKYIIWVGYSTRLIRFGHGPQNTLSQVPTGHYNIIFIKLKFTR